MSGPAPRARSTDCKHISTASEVAARRDGGSWFDASCGYWRCAVCEGLATLYAVVRADRVEVISEDVEAIARALVPGESMEVVPADVVRKV